MQQEVITRRLGLAAADAAAYALAQALKLEQLRGSLAEDVERLREAAAAARARDMHAPAEALYAALGRFGPFRQTVSGAAAARAILAAADAAAAVCTGTPAIYAEAAPAYEAAAQAAAAIIARAALHLQAVPAVLDGPEALRLGAALAAIGWLAASGTHGTREASDAVVAAMKAHARAAAAAARDLRGRTDADTYPLEAVTGALVRVTESTVWLGP